MSDNARSVADLVIRAAQTWPERVAVKGPDRTITYAELDDAANRIAHALGDAGVKPGDRVGIRLTKSAATVAAMQAALRVGAVYVPIDPVAPAARARTVLEDCDVAALFGADDARGLVSERVRFISSSIAFDGARAKPVAHRPSSSSDLAYILYTSGSTGKPKGVCISHENALAFVDWATRAIEANERDVFASHAPFHFDLSVLDLYGAFSVGASVALIPEGAAYIAPALVDFLHEERITVWYSVPSALVLMMEQAALLERGPASLRTLIFAGEPFPMKQLRALRNAWRIPLWNFYGPTETNVCTAWRVDEIADGATSIPIGRAVSGDRCFVRKDDGSVASDGEDGELVVEGPTVFLGYWGREAQKGAYATGDIVRARDGVYDYVGRRDHLVKVRGVRIELGDVEHALASHALVREACVVVKGSGVEARIAAFLAVGEREPTLLDIKRHCAERLPRAMIPDEVRCMKELPRTPNGKVDRKALRGEG